MRVGVRSKNKSWLNWRESTLGQTLTTLNDIPPYLLESLGFNSEGREDFSHQHPETQSRRNLDFKLPQWAINDANQHARIQR